MNFLSKPLFSIGIIIVLMNVLLSSILYLLPDKSTAMLLSIIFAIVGLICIGVSNITEVKQ